MQVNYYSLKTLFFKVLLKYLLNILIIFYILTYLNDFYLQDNRENITPIVFFSLFNALVD